MAARKRKGTKANPWHEVVRERLRGHMLEKKLMDHIDSKREMSQTQLRAALGLLDKILPTLTENDTRVTGDLTVNIYRNDDRRPPK